MKDKNEEMQRYLDEYICRSGNPYPTVEDLNRYITAFFTEKMPELDNEPKNVEAMTPKGYTFDALNTLHVDPFGKKSMIVLQTLPEKEYEKIPILRQFKYFIQVLKRDGSIKYDRSGCLSRDLLLEVYPLGVIDQFIDCDLIACAHETDVMSIRVLKLLFEESGLVKKKKNVLTFTSKGEKMFDEMNNSELFRLILDTMIFKINKGNLDDFDSLNIGNWGFGYTLLLLSKYGNVVHDEQFYAEHYFAAYPVLLEEADPYVVEKTLGCDCYFTRAFRGVLEQLGLVEIDEYLPNEFDDVCIDIKKTKLFDKLIKQRK